LITTAAKRGKASNEHLSTAIAAMVELNRRASKSLFNFERTRMTDIYRIWSAGHICEVAKASDVSVHIDHRQLPLLPGTLEYSQAGLCAQA
jgi:selenide,water dikinase